MIIYNVYQKDGDNLILKFSTLNKDKANNFVQEYNKYYNAKYDFTDDKYFISSIDTGNVDKQADEIINSYSLKRITSIHVNKYQQKYTIEYTRLKYINVKQHYDSAVIDDYENDFGTWNNASIILITDSLKIPDIEDVEIKKYINQLIENNIKYLQYLYEKY